MKFTKLQERCIVLMAEWFDRQQGGFFTPEKLAEELGIDRSECLPLVQMLDDLGALTDVMHADGELGAFNVTFRAVELKQAIESQRYARVKWWGERLVFSVLVPIIVSFATAFLVFKFLQ